MNMVIINGYVMDLTKASSYAVVDGRKVYSFLVLCNGVVSETACKVPVRAFDEQAVLCYSSLTTESYVEIVGELVRETPTKFYVHLRSILYKAPKKKRQFYMKSTEFFQLYKPSNVINELVRNGGEIKKKTKKKEKGIEEDGTRSEEGKTQE